MAATAVLPQAPRKQNRARPPVKPEIQTPSATNPEPTPEPTVEPTPSEEVQDAETLKIDTNLVTVPVIATTREGNYIADLQQQEFSIWENGEKQEVAFFAAVSAPFHVVLLLDTSASTQDKLGSIQRAAVAFLDQLQRADRVKIISFDNQLRELSDFTNDRAVLKKAIYQTASGQGTKLYDAFELALSSIRTIPGRKAIVLFSDGVDWHSDEASFDGTLQGLDEAGVIVYPIRWETRAESERIARESSGSSSLPTADVIPGRSSGPTPPTFPSDDPSTFPTTRQPKSTGPFGLPTADEIMRRRREQDPNASRFPDRRADPADPRDGGTGRGDGSQPSIRNRRRDDSITTMLDGLYSKADSYLLELATKSGGRIVRADTLATLPDAFAKIAAELRTQYAVGYYPTNKAKTGDYRKIKVTNTRKDVVLRARPGYRVRRGA